MPPCTAPSERDATGWRWASSNAPGRISRWTRPSSPHRATIRRQVGALPAERARCGGPRAWTTVRMQSARRASPAFRRRPNCSVKEGAPKKRSKTTFVVRKTTRSLPHYCSVGSSRLPPLSGVDFLHSAPRARERRKASGQGSGRVDRHDPRSDARLDLTPRLAYRLPSPTERRSTRQGRRGATLIHPSIGRLRIFEERR